MNRKKVSIREVRPKRVSTGRPRGRPLGSKTVNRKVKGGCYGDKKCKKCNAKLCGGVNPKHTAENCRKCNYDRDECLKPKYKCDYAYLLNLTPQEEQQLKLLALTTSPSKTEKIASRVAKAQLTKQLTKQYQINSNFLEKQLSTEKSKSFPKKNKIKQLEDELKALNLQYRKDLAKNKKKTTPKLPKPSMPIVSPTPISVSPPKSYITEEEYNEPIIEPMAHIPSPKQEKRIYDIINLLEENINQAEKDLDTVSNEINRLVQKYRAEGYGDQEIRNISDIKALEQVFKNHQHNIQDLYREIDELKFNLQQSTSFARPRPLHKKPKPSKPYVSPIPEPYFTPPSKSYVSPPYEPYTSPPYEPIPSPEIYFSSPSPEPYLSPKGRVLSPPQAHPMPPGYESLPQPIDIAAYAKAIAPKPPKEAKRKKKSKKAKKEEEEEEEEEFYSHPYEYNKFSKSLPIVANPYPITTRHPGVKTNDKAKTLLELYFAKPEKKKPADTYNWDPKLLAPPFTFGDTKSRNFPRQILNGVVAPPTPIDYFETPKKVKKPIKLSKDITKALKQIRTARKKKSSPKKKKKRRSKKLY